MGLVERHQIIKLLEPVAVLAKNDVFAHFLKGQIFIGLLALLLRNLLFLKGKSGKVSAKQNHRFVFSGTVDACGFQKLLRSGDGVFDVVDFVWIVVLLFLSTLCLYCIKSTVRKIGQIEKCVFFQFEYI